MFTGTGSAQPHDMNRAEVVAGVHRDRFGPATVHEDVIIDRERLEQPGDRGRRIHTIHERPAGEDHAAARSQIQGGRGKRQPRVRERGLTEQLTQRSPHRGAADEPAARPRGAPQGAQHAEKPGGPAGARRRDGVKRLDVEADSGRREVGEHALLCLQSRVGRGVDRSDDGSGAGPGDVRHRDSGPIEHLQHPELRHRPRAAAREGDAQLATRRARAVAHGCLLETDYAVPPATRL